MSQSVLSAENVVKHFSKRQSIVDRLRKKEVFKVPAIDGVTLDLRTGETLGLVGESGCGKSTLGRTLVGLYAASSGSISLNGKKVDAERTLEERRSVQMVFQDPFSSLNPRMTVGEVLREAISFHKLVPKEKVEDRSLEILSLVGLPMEALKSYPRQFSGGQRQRIGIARALALEPKVLIADEVVSALDVSVQASVVNLLMDLKRDLGLTMLFISHNIAVVRQVSDRIAVMYLGRIVEIGPTEEVFNNPSHPYTKLLLSSVPKMTSGSQISSAPDGEIQSIKSAMVGCRFRGRCPVAIADCATVDPNLKLVEGTHQAACLLV
ncbi:MAG: ABC transporter ATP-binding protein [Actinobacteria bacterium]|nr:ABC transporter ATP-binding protein [Actinomycetota bacterium]